MKYRGLRNFRFSLLDTFKTLEVTLALAWDQYSVEFGSEYFLETEFEAVYLHYIF